MQDSKGGSCLQKGQSIRYVNNYRPISLQLSINMVIEKVLYKQLSKFLEGKRGRILLCVEIRRVFFIYFSTKTHFTSYFPPINNVLPSFCQVHRCTHFAQLLCFQSTPTPKLYAKNTFYLTIFYVFSV